MDDDPQHVGDDEVGRVFEVERVGLQLAQRRVQVLVVALVFPAEAAAPPDIGPAVAAADFLRAALETVALAFRIVLGRRRLAEQAAEVDEMLLRALPLPQLAVAPLS